jgi:hypothetical protein
MGKKLALNVAYTIGLFLSAITAYWGFTNHKYSYAVGGVVVAILFLILKGRLLKDLRNPQK